MDEELVITPGGLRPKSKVHLIQPGHKLIVKNNHIQEIDSSGKFVEEFGEVNRSGRSKPFESEQTDVVNATTAALGSGWITRAYWDNAKGASFSDFMAEWFVPAQPSTQSGQVIYVFMGLQNSSFILQPTLQWGSAAGGGGNFWSVASWYILSSGETFHSPFVTVQPGRNLPGDILLTNATELDYRCEIQGIPETVFSPPPLNENFTEAVVALQAYGITKCSDYPATFKTPMRSMGVALFGQTDRPEGLWKTLDSITDCRQQTVMVKNQSGEQAEAAIYYDSQAPNSIKFGIKTGADDLRGGDNGSAATADVFYPGGQFKVTLKNLDDSAWPNKSFTEKTIPLPPNIPRLDEGITDVRINLEQGSSALGADNWDIERLHVSLLNSSKEVCQLDLPNVHYPSHQLQDNSNGLIRLSLSPGSSGSGRSSPKYHVTGPC